MLSVSGWNRRAFLRAGSLALGGLSLPSLMAQDVRRAVTGRSVVFLFMHGGPPQTETFDPKMDAPSGIRSVTGEIPTTLPGVTFGGSFPKLAKLAHKLAVVRSFVPGNDSHDLKPLVSLDTLKANLGSLYARVAGINHPGTGLPTNAALFPKAVDAAAQPATSSFGRFDSTGLLGGAYAPFSPGQGGSLEKDMVLSIAPDRLDDRRELLRRLDLLRREADAPMEGVDRLREQAYRVVLGGAAKAFDLSQEDPKVVERYDTSRLVPRIDQKWNNRKNYADHVNTLGRLMLLARRLCENGCGFVTVTTNFVWDFHADVNNATVEEGLRYAGDPFDHAVSAFVQDVESRGLSDKILLVACGEMGRTPRINAKGGRDHWGKLGPLLLYGGGLKMGRVIGSSTKDAGEANTDAVTPKMLIGTILRTLLDVGEARLLSGLPTELLALINDAEAIPGL
ncbi:MAG TPA: DUF1501 domain-containing protein [Planctomycetota bacterium]